jgi:hypothetical protein
VNVPARAIAAIAIVCAAGVAAAQSTTGELGGVVLERGSERPLVGVTVTLVDSGRSAITDEEGRFRFSGAPAGPHTLTLAPPDAEPVTVEEEVLAGRRRDVRYLLAPTVRRGAYQSTVRAPRVERASVVETGVTREEARRTAGAGDDPLKVVEDLPGVARATVGTGDVIVWGAAPADTRVLFDGVEWPALFHVGGWRSTVNAGLVSRVSLTPGGFGAEWGRALGGLVRIDGIAPPPPGFHGEVGADLLDGSALLSYANGRFAITVAGRYSWLDRAATAVVHGDAAAFVPLPRWDDYQLRASVALRRRERLTLTFLAADDALRRTVSAGDPTSERSDQFDRSSYRALLRYDAETDGAAVEVTPWFGYDGQSRVDQYGPIPAHLSTAAWLAGLRAAYRRRVGAHDPVFGQPPGDDVAAADDRIHQLDAAPFASVDVRVGPLTVTPGLRLEALLLQGDHVVPPVGTTPPLGWTRVAWAADPRLALRWQAHPRVAVVAAGGLYHQPPDPADLGARFGNPTLGPARAAVASAGVEARIVATLSAEATGFYRQLDDLPSRSPSPSPAVAAALVEDGSGRAYGGQLLVRAAPWHGWSGWLSYTAGRSERRDHPTSAWRLSDYDQTHILTLVVGYALRHWDFGARLRWASGFPRTPVIGSYFDARDARWDPLFGAQNGIRIPDFVQLDLRAEYAFVFSRAQLRLYLDVQNVTYQRNAEEIVYDPTYTQRGTISGLPTLAVLGAKVTW